MLTTDQINYFEAFGFLCLRQLFSPAEMADITREADELLAVHAGVRHGPTHQSVSPFDQRPSNLPPDDN